MVVGEDSRENKEILILDIKKVGMELDNISFEQKVMDIGIFLIHIEN